MNAISPIGRDPSAHDGLSDQAAYALADIAEWRSLAPTAAALRDGRWGPKLTYSRKVFIPLTNLCRNVCHYCTFAQPPSKMEDLYLLPEQVLEIARAGQAAGCKEALFTLGDKPELRYEQARDALARLGFDTTLGYVAHCAKLVLEETGLLPHVNAGVMGPEDYARLRLIAPSMGIMLESASERLCERGGAHFGSPDKQPSVRLRALADAGEARVPMTSGILIGIGETRIERIDSILSLRNLSRTYGHIQEVIIQNFRAKPETRMATASEPDMDELCWTIAAARLILGANISIQAPPNLAKGRLEELIAAGINDWGGISPITPDHVNPEAPWPHLDLLAEISRDAGYDLVERLTIYPSFLRDAPKWMPPSLHAPVMRVADAAGFARPGTWVAGSPEEVSQDDLDDVPRQRTYNPRSNSPVRYALDAWQEGATLIEEQIVDLFSARGPDFEAVCEIADTARRSHVGDDVTFAVVRNINYTNICKYRCGFCAFSKGKTHEHLRGRPYLLDLDEIRSRVREAWERGATEVCMQGGIHPDYTGETYLAICRAAKEAVPDMHVHAFSPLEVSHGAATLGLPVAAYLAELKHAGLGSLPGTAAEILDDEIRVQIAPDKLGTQGWLDVVAAAHSVGLKTTSTIMFGHVENYSHWARHLLRLRALQEETGGITEFVPLPFVHMEAPIYLRGQARRGPTLREAILMHSVARLTLAPLIPNIQASWVKLGPAWAQRCLQAGANDLGGTLMNESISRAAGASHGQEFTPAEMRRLIAQTDRKPVQRTTLYSRPFSEFV